MSKAVAYVVAAAVRMILHGCGGCKEDYEGELGKLKECCGSNCKVIEVSAELREFTPYTVAVPAPVNSEGVECYGEHGVNAWYSGIIKDGERLNREVDVDEACEEANKL